MEFLYLIFSAVHRLDYFLAFIPEVRFPPSSRSPIALRVEDLAMWPLRQRRELNTKSWQAARGAITAVTGMWSYGSVQPLQTMTSQTESPSLVEMSLPQAIALPRPWRPRS